MMQKLEPRIAGFKSTKIGHVDTGQGYSYNSLAVSGKKSFCCGDKVWGLFEVFFVARYRSKRFP